MTKSMLVREPTCHQQVVGELFKVDPLSVPLHMNWFDAWLCQRGFQRAIAVRWTDVPLEIEQCTVLYNSKVVDGALHSALATRTAMGYSVAAEGYGKPYCFEFYERLL